MPDTLAVMPRRRKAADNPEPPRAKQPAAKTDTVRIEEDLAEKATIIAIRRKTSVSELISPHLRPFLEAEYAKEVLKMSKQLEK